MGFLAFCGLFCVVVVVVWRAVRSKDERTAIFAGLKKEPAHHVFLFVWIIAIFTFFVGIFAPIIGESEFFDTGWQIWQVGGAFSLLGFAISLFWSPR